MPAFFYDFKVVFKEGFVENESDDFKGTFEVNSIDPNQRNIF